MVASVVFLGALLAAPLALAQGFTLGDTVDRMLLTDVKGAPLALDGPGSPATVVVFVATQCPVSNGYNERMNALYKEYSARGVRFVFVNSNRTEEAANVADHAAKNFSFAVHKDPDNVLADRFNAQVTPETFVLDRNGVIRYHGAIDDSPSNAAQVTARPLRDAIDAVLAGKEVPRKEVKAMGCTIKRVKKTS